MSVANDVVYATLRESGIGFTGGGVAYHQWNHIAFTVDQAGGRLYINGRLVASQPWAGLPGQPVPVADPSVVIGGLLTSLQEQFVGDMDELSFWSRALSLEEIIRYKDNRIDPDQATGLLAWFPLDEDSGVEAGDESGRGHVLSVRGTEWTDATAPGQGATPAGPASAEERVAPVDTKEAKVGLQQRNGGVVSEPANAQDHAP